MWDLLTPGMTFRNYLAVLGMIVLSLLAALVTRLIWRFILLPIARRTPTALDVLVLEHTQKTAPVCVVTAALYLSYATSVQLLQIDPTKSEGWINGVFFVIAVLLACRIAYEVASAVIEWYVRDFSRQGTGHVMPPQFAPVVQRVAKVAILGIGLITALAHFNVNVGGLLATAGIASLAVALAAQESVANIIGGFALMADRTFRPGDRLEFGNNVVGDVVDVGLRTTRVHTLEDTMLIVPNAELAKARIVNQSFPTPRVAVREPIGISYDSDVEKAKRVLLEIAASDKDVLKNPAPLALFIGFGDSALNILYIFWIADYRTKGIMLDRINTEIVRRFREEKIEIPFPQRDVHIRSVAGPVNSGDNGEHEGRRIM